jgi:hypothetical protein
MVQLHPLEHGSGDVRPTLDIDVLGQGRPPGAIPAIDKALRADGFTAVEPDAEGYAFRYERDGVVVDLLAPDGIKPPPKFGGLKAIGIPGGSQALQRSGPVTVIVDQVRFVLRRPNLVGAILIKARSLMVHSDPATQREDLLRLLGLLEDPRAAAADLRATEKRWLKAVEDKLEFSAFTALDPTVLERADLAYRLLVR